MAPGRAPMEDGFVADELPDRDVYRPSRTNYPGSKHGPKSRYDLPQRRKAYGNADIQDLILFSDTPLQPPTWTAGGGDGGSVVSRSPPLSLQGPMAPHRDSTVMTPRSAGALTGVARSMFHPMADRNLPDLPLINERNDVHGMLVLGGKESGKTSLVMSLAAAATGSYPVGPEVREKRLAMPTYGQGYELPGREVKLADGSSNEMRLLLTDTPACGTDPREEQPLCTKLSPNSTQHSPTIPSWMRITMRSGNFPHYSVIFVIDSTATPLWEDMPYCRELARLLCALKRSQYTVVLAVTKLPKAREIALRNRAHGKPGMDPRASYEPFSSRYVEKVSAALQAVAGENEWSLAAGGPSFPLVNTTIFDVPTWVTGKDYELWQGKKGTTEMPHLRYATTQLQKLLAAACIRSCVNI